MALPCIDQRAKVWLVDTSVSAPESDFEVLSEAEREAAARLVQPGRRNQYRMAHLWFRRLLAQHLGQAPASLTLQAGPQGKPFLPRFARCQFNLSHSGNWALIGISSAPTLAGLGVDLEVLRVIDLLPELCAQVLTPQESTFLMRLSPHERSAGFLRIWVCKEAALKAIGQGLAIPPLRVQTDPEHAQGQALIGQGACLQRVQVYTMTHPQGLVLALALALALDDRAQKKATEW